MTNKKMRVVVLGYYGHLNAGDDLLQAAMSYIFQEHSLMFSSWFPGSDLLNQADLVVIGGGSIWPGNTAFQFADKLAKHLRTPVMILGISAKSADEKIKNKTLELIERSTFTHVRDSDTAQVLGLHPKIRTGVDLFWWMPSSCDEAKETSPDNSKQVALSLREWKAAEWKPQQIVSVIRTLGYDIKAFPLYFGSPVHDPSSEVNDSTFLQRLGINHVPLSWTTKPVEESQFVVAMRYHAVLVAIRMGRPVISFDYHRKLQSFFRENGIEELCVSLNDPQALTTAIEMLESNYSRYKTKFTKLREALLAAGSSDLAACKNAISSIQPKHRQTPNIRRFIAKLASRCGL